MHNNFYIKETDMSYFSSRCYLKKEKPEENVSKLPLVTKVYHQKKAKCMYVNDYTWSSKLELHEL